MAELSYWWTTSATPTGDQQPSYSQAHLATISKVLGAAMGAEGVVPDPMGVFGGELTLSSPSSNTTRVSPGAAIVDGHPYVNDANVDLVHDATPSSRSDAIVLRADWANFNVSIVLLKGVDGGPAPTLQTARGSVFDVLLGYADLDSSGNISYVYSTRVWAVPQVDDVTIERTPNDFALRVKDQGISAAKLAPGSVVEAKLGTAAVTTGKIADSAVTANKIATGAVSTDKIASSAVTNAKIATNAVAGGNIVDAAVTANKIANNAVISTKYGLDSIDDDKVHYRIPVIKRRRSSSPGDWDAAGNTIITPTRVEITAGAATLPTNGTSTGSIDISHTHVWPGRPLIIALATDPNLNLAAYNLTNSSFRIEWKTVDGLNMSVNAVAFWIALGAG